MGNMQIGVLNNRRGSQMRGAAGAVDCDFTLALNNRTGKFFFCADLIEASRDIIANCYYWRVRFPTLPRRNLARVLGRLARMEVDIRVWLPSSDRYIRTIARYRPMVFTDPRECVLYQMKRDDLVLCHDMGPLTHPQLYAPGVEQLYTIAFEKIKTAKPAMLFVSEATRRDFVRLYGSDFPLMEIVHPPIRSGMEGGSDRKVAGVPSNFFLTVGSIGTRKNQTRAIRAFEASGLALKGYGYVICGGPEPGADEVIKLAQDTAGVILPGYVNDQELRWLYRNARGFVLPSLLEGFGLPAGEAISYGLVPILSGGGALEEVAGDGAIYVDPFNIAEISEAMKWLANLGAEEHAARVGRLRQSIKRFTAENAVSTWRSALMHAARSKIAEAEPA
jgi:glycosyltransferase involved in cell wall biosynthesis